MFNTGDDESGYLNLEKAIELNPSFRLDLLSEAVGSYLHRENKKADKLMSIVLNMSREYFLIS